jgi:hypothetical protein
MMKMLVTILLCTLSTLSAQTTSRTFKSPDGRFQYKYSSLLVRCTRDENEDGYLSSWSPEDCEAYSPVCEVPGTIAGSQGSSPVICLAYRNRFGDDSTFEAAAFSAEEIKGTVTEKDCLTGSSDWALDEGQTGKIITINGARFKQFEAYSFGSSHYLDEHIFRNFHANRCYQLSINTASANGSVSDPPAKELTSEDWAEVDSELRKCLESFRFLK